MSPILSIHLLTFNAENPLLQLTQDNIGNIGSAALERKLAFFKKASHQKSRLFASFFSPVKSFSY